MNKIKKKEDQAMGLVFQARTRESLRLEIVDYIKHVARAKRDAAHKSTDTRRAKDLKIQASALFSVAHEVENSRIDLWVLERKEKERAIRDDSTRDSKGRRSPNRRPNAKVV